MDNQCEAEKTTWTDKQIRDYLQYAHKFVDHVITDKPARRTGGSIIMVRCSSTKMFELDGRRSMNLWSKTPGNYPVILIHARKVS